MEKNGLSKNQMLVFVLAVVLFLYILLHELGHLIVMLWVGTTITEFSILTAHVSGVGGNYNDFTALWLHANGVLLPVSIIFLFLLFYKKEKENQFYHIFSYVAAIATTMSLLTWIIIPFVYLFGAAPAGDDVTKFLQNFVRVGYHPLIVSIVAACLVVVNVFLIIKKGIMKNAMSVINDRPNNEANK